MQNGRWWPDRRVSMVGGRGGLAPPPPLGIRKKEAVRRNFNLFHLYFTNEIRARVHSKGRGVLPPPPPRNGKKDAVRRNFNLFHLCFTNEIRGQSIYYTCKMEKGGRTGACP